MSPKGSPGPGFAFGGYVRLRTKSGQPEASILAANLGLVRGFHRFGTSDKHLTGVTANIAKGCVAWSSPTGLRRYERCALLAGNQPSQGGARSSAFNRRATRCVRQNPNHSLNGLDWMGVTYLTVYRHTRHFPSLSNAGVTVSLAEFLCSKLLSY